MRLAVLATHPVQYYAPLFRTLAERVELMVYYGQRGSPEQQAAAGFGVAFEWDVDLLAGYSSTFLDNVATRPDLSTFPGTDTPDVGARLDADGPFDALLVLGWYQKTFWQGVLAARRRGIPVLVRGDSRLAPPGSGLKGRLKDVARHGLYPLALRGFAAALPVGAHSERYYRAYRYPADRLFRSPHAIDTAWFAERGTAEAGRALREEVAIGPSETVVLFAGKLVPFKRPGDVVDALARMREGGTTARLMIAGSGSLEDEVAARADATGVPTTFLGFCNQSRMPAVYAAADVLALPSTARETWGLVANEALACGTPVVLSDAVGSAPDLGVPPTGRSFPLGDVDALALALADVLANPPDPASFAEVNERFSLTRAADGIVRAMASVRGNPHGAGPSGNDPPPDAGR